MGKENKAIKTRIYYAVKITLASPICVSGGMDEFTDTDVLVNGSGTVFVPGTSLAGAMRNYLELEKNKPGIFGYSDREDGQMSSVYVSDLYFSDVIRKDQKTEPVISVRDGITLTEGKQVKKGQKFDMQIIETGAQGTIYLNGLIREGEDQAIFEQDICDILFAIQDGSIRIGAKKNRGFGRIRIEQIYRKKFSFESEEFDLSEWLKFKKNFKTLSGYGECKTFEEWKSGRKISQEERYLKIQVPLKLTGGISIRKYATRPGEADFEHITCNGQPIIPGSSWNGAIRADVKSILTELGMKLDEAEKKIDKWFGYVSEEKSTAGGENAEQSRVVISESEITDAERLPMKRTSTNRFDASTKDGALYSEMAFFGGNTELDIMVRKDGVGKYSGEDHSWHALVAVLNMVIEDIQDGFVPVGGQTAVGRGIFAADTDREVTYSEEVPMDTCMEELYALL